MDIHYKIKLIVAAAVSVFAILVAAFIARPSLFYYTGFSLDHCVLIYAADAPTATQAEIAIHYCRRLH
tara:strand:+ start:235 stop:438 length:204 start_codon:yes stop_codon:yes gene_type:complete